MEKVAVSKFRDNMTFFLKKVREGQTITITSRGHDLAKLVPLEHKVEEARATLKQIAETAKIGDIVSPLGEHWDATQ